MSATGATFNIFADPQYSLESTIGLDQNLALSRVAIQDSEFLSETATQFMPKSIASTLEKLQKQLDCLVARMETVESRVEAIWFTPGLPGAEEAIERLKEASGQSEE